MELKLELSSRKKIGSDLDQDLAAAEANITQLQDALHEKDALIE